MNTKSKFFKRGERVNFLYVSKDTNSIYFEENVEVSNSSFEDTLLKEQPTAQLEPMYYFMNPGGRIQSPWIPAHRVWAVDEYPAARILYAKNRKRADANPEEED